MIYANKKVQQTANLSAQNGKIISTIAALEEKNMVRIQGNEIYLEPSLWKNHLLAVNWIKCAHIYCGLRLRFKEKDPIYFKDIHTGADIGSYQNKKAKVLLFK